VDASAPALSGAPLDVVAEYRRQSARRLAGLGIAAAVLLVCVTVDVATGPAFLPLRAVAASLAGNSGGGTPVDAIVWTIRLPMALMAVVVGAALAMSGAAMQTILNNPLASSYTLGISAAAGFGAALAIVLGAGLPVAAEYVVPVNAFLFAAAACGTVLLIGRQRGMMPETMVLTGIALLFLFQALQSLLQYLASPETLQTIVFWLFGSLLKATWPKVGLVAAVVAAVGPLLLRDAWRLTALRLGEERARGLGVNVAALRVRIFLAVSLLTAVAVSFVGTIGFVGLVAPHVARMLAGEDQRILLPLSGLAGAILLSGASIASKTVHPGAIVPIGIVTAMIGVPFFFALVLRGRQGYW
jgi:iron complex transport system permease protein